MAVGPLLLSLCVSASVSCILAILLTPVVRRLAIAYGVIDAPDGFRKLHGRSVPLSGGVAVIAAAGLTTVGAMLLGVFWAPHIMADPWLYGASFTAAAWICLLGVLDDRFQLRGRQKLAGQVLAAGIAVCGGLTIRSIEVFGITIELGLLTVPFTIFWLLGAVNALNLIDGVDGLASTVGIILSVTISVLALSTGHIGEAAVAAVLAGALLGFLLYNWPPASIFLGDAGSMFIGFSLGLLAIRSSLKGPATVALVAPTAIWAIPIFDVAMAILRRRLTGQSIYATDRGHLHHVLQRRGLGSVGVVMTIGTLCALCGMGALTSVFLKSEFTAVAVTTAILALLVASRLFGHAECGLLMRQSSRFVTTLFRRSLAATEAESMISRFHGNREFEEAWRMLTELAMKFEVAEINCNINAPMLGEVYHAHWKRRGLLTHVRSWTTEVPLMALDREIGRLQLKGMVPAEASSFRWSSDLLEACAAFETQVVDILCGSEAISRVQPVAVPQPELVGVPG